MSPVTPPPTPRFDIYALIHKGIRAALVDALGHAGRLDWTEHDEVNRLVAASQDLALLCRAHVAHEEHFVHRAMEARRPGSARQACADHRGHVADIDRLETLALELAHLPTLRREAAAKALYAHLAHFTADNLAHMAHEEREHNRVLWETHDDEELVALEAAIVASQTPEEARLALRWMLPNLAPAERHQMMAGMREGMPPEVFRDTLASTAGLLDARNALKLHDALGIARRPLDYVGMP